MINLEATITHTENRTLIVDTPSFWKDPTDAYDIYRAVLDDKTYVEIRRLHDGEIVTIRHSDIKHDAREILEAQQYWTPVTEQEFMQNYDDAWESMRLQPKLV